MHKKYADPEQRIRRAFNSLFEMRDSATPTPKFLSTDTFNSLFEMRRHEDVEHQRRPCKPFNSLFEMR